MIDKIYARKILEHFCSMPIDSSEQVLNEFAKLPGAISCFDGGKNNFVYVPGIRKDRVVLVAHADTVWDSEYTNRDNVSRLFENKQNSFGIDDDIYVGTNPSFGIGADDRAGCAILWLLKDIGHSLLITDGEEDRQKGSNHLKTNYPELLDEVNNHSYIIQFDRRGATDYKFYNLPVSERFKTFVQTKTGYYDAGSTARTDIVALCQKICGVNLSIGYYDEHTPAETLNFLEWHKTLNIAYELLQEEQQQFLLEY